MVTEHLVYVPQDFGTMCRLPCASRTLSRAKVISEKMNNLASIHCYYMHAQVDVRYGGEPVQGSPFTVNVTDQVHGAQVVNFNQADHRFFENREANIPIKIAEGSSADYLKCRVTDPEMELLHNELSYDPTTNLYHVRFVPLRPGRHRVDVEYDGVPVEGSPFMLNIEGSEGHKKVFASGDGLKGGE